MALGHYHSYVKEPLDLRGFYAYSGCLQGRVSKRLVQNDYEGAKEAAIMLRDIFGDDFYLEIQDHGIPEQKRINPLLIKLSKEFFL